MRIWLAGTMGWTRALWDDSEAVFSVSRRLNPTGTAYDGTLSRQVAGAVTAAQVQIRGGRRCAFLTEPLRGVGSTAPCGHDGRSINLREVIVRHGGKAGPSRDKSLLLSDVSQSRLIRSCSRSFRFRRTTCRRN